MGIVKYLLFHRIITIMIFFFILKDISEMVDNVLEPVTALGDNFSELQVMQMTKP